jgi:hypothetical protein
MEKNEPIFLTRALKESVRRGSDDLFLVPWILGFLAFKLDAVIQVPFLAHLWGVPPP